MDGMGGMCGMGGGMPMGGMGGGMPMGGGMGGDMSGMSGMGGMGGAGDGMPIAYSTCACTCRHRAWAGCRWAAEAKTL